MTEPEELDLGTRAPWPASRARLRYRRFAWLLVLGVLVFGNARVARSQSGLLNTNALPSTDLTLERSLPSIWEEGVGQGFRSSTEAFSLGAGATYGLKSFGSAVAHDLAIAELCYGHMLTGPLAKDYWFRGNFEARVQLFTGSEFSPTTDWFVGLTPHIRYNFATGSRLIPYADGGAGVTATGIGPPDLSGTFEFNLQYSAGAMWFIKDDVALNLEAGFMHWSCGGIHSPNLGLNVIKFMAGISFYF